MASLARTDRGQLIVIGAVALAILLVVIALSLNTALLGVVHVAQADSSLTQERGALAYQSSVDRGVAGILEHLDDGATTYTAIEAAVTTELDAWDAVVADGYHREAVSTGVTVQDVTFISTVIHDEVGPFADQSGATNWTLAEDVSTIHAYEITIEEAATFNVSDCTDADCFQLDIHDGTDEWSMAVRAGDNESLWLSFPGTQCQQLDTPVTIDVMAGTTSDPSCTFTPVTEEVAGPYTVSYGYADGVEGTYQMTATGKLVEDTIADDPRYGTTGSPRIEATPAGATVDLRYRSPGLQYATETTVELEGVTDA